MSTWRAHAKLTMSLHVTGVRHDGYHLIDAEMVSLELHDVVSFEPPARPDAPTLTAIGPFADGVPTDATNLVARALALTGSRADTTIDKRIPHGGGLGGGSTDAATALRWGGFGASRTELERAGRLGADIPFCLVGGRAHVSGIGEVVEPLPHVSRTVTLVIPPLRVSTPAVYRAWDDLGQPSDGAVRNELENAAIVVEPDLARWRRLIHERIDIPPTLAGSGATWFVVGSFEHELADLAALGATVVVTHTVDAGRATGPGT